MNTIDGIAYLMVTEQGLAPYVLRYTAAEMVEIFRAAELEALRRDGALVRGSIRYVDMIAAAQVVR